MDIGVDPVAGRIAPGLLVCLFQVYLSSHYPLSRGKNLLYNTFSRDKTWK